MYAVIRAGGKQHKVAKGDIIEVEKVTSPDGNVEFTPLLVVDDKGNVRSAKSDLAAARVTGTVLGEIKGEKIEVYKFKNKSGYRRHTGHRQTYSRVEISGIKLTAGRTSNKTEDTEDGA